MRVSLALEELISFAICDFEATEVIENSNAVIYLNPEYGDRLGMKLNLRKHTNMGDFLKQKCKGCTGYIFTGNLNWLKDRA